MKRDSLKEKKLIAEPVTVVGNGIAANIYATTGTTVVTGIRIQVSCGAAPGNGANDVVRWVLSWEAASNNAAAISTVANTALYNEPSRVIFDGLFSQSNALGTTTEYYMPMHLRLEALAAIIFVADSGVNTVCSVGISGQIWLDEGHMAMGMHVKSRNSVGSRNKQLFGAFFSAIPNVTDTSQVLYTIPTGLVQILEYTRIFMVCQIAPVAGEVCLWALAATTVDRGSTAANYIGGAMNNTFQSVFLPPEDMLFCGAWTIINGGSPGCPQFKQTNAKRRLQAGDLFKLFMRSQTAASAASFFATVESHWCTESC